MGYKPGGGTGAVGPVGPAAGTFQALTPLAVNGNNAAHATSGALVASWLPYTDPSFYVDPVGGNDANNGTIGAPFLTIDRVNQVVAPGFFGTLTINLRAGTHTIAAKTVWPSPSGKNSATAGGVLLNGVDNTDSGLGARTSAGGTTGSVATFGTCIDSVGGLVVNAHRGQFLRFTSGATLNGRSFLIDANSAGTFTLVGTLPVAPTTETFVVETPAAVVSWAASQTMMGAGVVGAQNVAFSGGGGANVLRLSGLVFGQQRCTFASIGTGGIALRNNAQLVNTSALVQYLGTLSITQSCGSHFNGVTQISLNLSAASGGSPACISLNQCLLTDTNIQVFGPINTQFVSCSYRGNSWTRVGYKGMFTASGCRWDAVTPAPALPSAIVGASGAAVVISKGAFGTVSNSDISNTPATTAPGDAIFGEDGSQLGVDTVTGAGNAGIGCRVNRMTGVRRNAGTTVTGAGGEVKIGQNAVTTWAALVAVQTDAVELCIGAPH